MVSDRSSPDDDSAEGLSTADDAGSADTESDHAEHASSVVSEHASSDPLSTEMEGRPSNATRTPNTLLNAVLGAAVTALTAFFVPLSPVLGGAIAGYLEGAGANSGLKVGALSGAIALIPLLVIVPFVLFVFVFEPIVAISLLVLFSVVVGFLAVYTVGFSALGGVLGVYLYEEFER